VIIERAPADSYNYIACPITKLEYNGFNKFVGIWTCGHILSRKAFKEVQVVKEDTKAKKCIVCMTEYQDKDVIDLSLDGAELERKRVDLLEKNLKAKKPTEENIEVLGEPIKKRKLDVHLNTIERLDGEFRDVIRERQCTTTLT
jgi:hypothetical protein